MKSQKMENELDKIAFVLFGTSRVESARNKTCVSCKKPATEFKNEISKKEYTLSMLCQVCQDQVFTLPDEEQCSSW
tara:strand:- start:2124 stop:2351 length:228 start_codon:yes stop_codon:yes gene_type:complete